MKSVKLLVTGIVLLCLSHPSFSQVYIDTTFATKMNQVFANLDKSKVPYGILRDYGMEFTDLDVFNGTAGLVDSNRSDAGSFWEVYNTLLFSRIHSSASGYLHPDTIENRWFSYRQPGRITLAGLFFNYSRFKNNASPNYITVSNNQLYDKYVNSVWQDPYQNEKVFLISPSVTEYKGKNFDLLLPSGIWLTNSSSSISSISVDINDGNGYRTITPGTALSVSYSDTGYKEWTYKLTLANSTYLYAHSYVHILDGPSNSARFRDASQTVTATTAYNGVYGKAIVTVDYANSDLKLRKPLIVAEGFDPGHILMPEDIYGFSNINGFIEDATNDFGSSLIGLLSGTFQQYDIVYVDWVNGTDYLQRNALALEEAIRWVNNKKASDGVSNQPNVVWGQSMGGVIARWALKDMEDNSELHNVRLFISHDAPQQGANVPQGYQHAVNQVKEIFVKLGIAGIANEIQFMGMLPSRALTLADQPAAKQMLINYVDNSNAIDNSVHNAWQTELVNLGYPSGDGVTSFRKVAVSNGSECAVSQPFSAGDALMYFQGKANTRFIGDLLTSFFFHLIGGQSSVYTSGVLLGRNDFNFDLYIASQADGSSNLVYKGKLDYKKSVLWLINVTTTINDRTYYSSSFNLPYDNFPGGVYVLPANFSAANFQNALVKFNAFGSVQPVFDFIPTVSALDIGSGNATLTKSDYLTSYVGSNPPSSPKNSPFDNFITAFNDGSDNEVHISIERRNGDWIASELNGSTPSANCTAFCGASINGSSTICASNQNYSLNITLPTGSSVSWFASPSGVVSISTSGNSATLSQLGYGTITLIALISTNSVCGDVLLNKTITVGGPQVDFYIFGNPLNQEFCTNAFGNFVEASPSSISNVTGFSWGYSSADNNISPTVINSSGSYSQEFMFTYGGNYQIFANATNGCGTGSIATLNIFVNDNCNGLRIRPDKRDRQLAIFPNPAKNILNITLPDSIDINNTIIVITDLSGRQLKRVQKVSYYNQINVSDLPSSIYLIEVFSNKKSLIKRKIVKN